MNRAGQLSELAREFTAETDYKRATEKMKAAHVQNPPAFAFLGVLAPIGIEKGKPFAPDARMKKILTESKGLVTNPDTSVDIWFGPTPPAGHEANWVQTVPGKGWNTILRLCGPLQPWFDKSWKPGELELVK